MAKRYDPIMCMMVDEPAKAHDELSLAQKKQVVIELKGYLKKSYNFSDESEYARAYEDLRHMFTTGSRKSISGLFENTVKKTGAHDAKVQDELKIVKEDGLWCVYKDGKVVGQSNSEAGALRLYRMFESKAQDAFVLKHSNGDYMSDRGRVKNLSNAKVFNSKSDAERYKGDKVVSFTDPDYNNWHVVSIDVRPRAHDSAYALDKAITTADGATGDKLYADVKAIYSLFSNILLTYSNEQSVQKLANEGTKKCLELASKVKNL